MPTPRDRMVPQQAIVTGERKVTIFQARFKMLRVLNEPIAHVDPEPVGQCFSRQPVRPMIRHEEQRAARPHPLIDRCGLRLRKGGGIIRIVAS